MDTKPWGAVEPNSQHQLWSKWVVRFPLTKTVDRQWLIDNTRRFAKLLFRSSVGEVKVDFLAKAKSTQVRLQVVLEGPPAHDPAYRLFAENQFRANFVEKGFGPLAASCMTIDTAILAGDTQDGKPPAQVIVLPQIISNVHLDMN